MSLASSSWFCAGVLASMALVYLVLFATQSLAPFYRTLFALWLWITFFIRQKLRRARQHQFNIDDLGDLQNLDDADASEGEQDDLVNIEGTFCHHDDSCTPHPTDCVCKSCHAKCASFIYSLETSPRKFHLALSLVSRSPPNKQDFVQRLLRDENEAMQLDNGGAPVFLTAVLAISAPVCRVINVRKHLSHLGGPAGVFAGMHDIPLLYLLWFILSPIDAEDREIIKDIDREHLARTAVTLRVSTIFQRQEVTLPLQPRVGSQDLTFRHLLSLG